MGVWLWVVGWVDGWVWVGQAEFWLLNGCMVDTSGVRCLDTHLRRALEKQMAPGVVLFHVALEGLLAGQLVAAQGELRQGSELPQHGRDAAREPIDVKTEVGENPKLAQLGGDAA